MVLRAISLRNSRNAVSKLRILWRQRYFTHFYLVIRGTPSRNSGFRVAHGILRNFVEKCEKRRLQTLDFALPLIFRATPLRYEKCRSQTVDSSLSIVFRAISWRNTRNAAGKLRISRCQRYFTQFDGELRGSPSPNCGFQVANRISRNFIEMQGMRSSICGFRVINNISRNFIEIRETPSPNWKVFRAICSPGRFSRILKPTFNSSCHVYLKKANYFLKTNNWIFSRNVANIEIKINFHS